MTFEEYVQHLNWVLKENPHTTDWAMSNAPQAVFHPYTKSVRIAHDFDVREDQ